MKMTVGKETRERNKESKGKGKRSTREKSKKGEREKDNTTEKLETSSAGENELVLQKGGKEERGAERVEARERGRSNQVTGCGNVHKW